MKLHIHHPGRKTTIALFIVLLFTLGVMDTAYNRPAGASGVTTWGVTFSHTFGKYIGVDWRELYFAILDDLKVRHIRIPIYWPVVEPTEGNFSFDDYDFIVREAEVREAKLILVVGKRVPRWPECHIPEWAKSFSEEEQKVALKKEIIAVVERYKYSDAVVAWQVENEPFLILFGECPPFKIGELDEEIALVKFLDPLRPMIVTDSGELSVWLPAYKRADIFGTTMYRSVWSDKVSPYIGYFTYPLPPQFFWLKANISRALYGDKPIIVSELQAEPWGPEFSRVLTMSEGETAETMSHTQFYDNIAYAREASFSEVYFWGVEWWYAMKVQKGDPFYWEAAKELFTEK